MEFNPTAYRILNYLKEWPGNFCVPTSEIFSIINCLNRDDFNDALFLLEKEDFIDGGKTDILITPEGRNYLRKIEKEKEESAYEYVYKDYDYCVIKFLYENNWGVKVEEFPTIIKKKAPECNKINNGNLIEYLYKQRDFIDEKNPSYYLNDNGITHYLLETERKKQEKELKAIPNISVEHIGDNYHSSGDYSPVSKGNQKFIEKKEAKKTPWWEKILGDVRAVIVGYIIVAIVSFFSGKSCNSTSHESQHSNSIHGSIK